MSTAAVAARTGDGSCEALAVAGLEAIALRAVRDAALASARWSGRGRPKAADAAATDAMRAALDAAAGDGVVRIGEGEKDDAPMLAAGERVGRGGPPRYDIVVDPLECTDFCARGLPGALATIAVGEPGCVHLPAAAFYMEKLVVPPAARDAVDLRDAPELTLERLARALRRPVEDLRVVVLEKPRHVQLIARLRASGARVHTPAAGDVAASLDVLLPGGRADALMGIGGAPEGVLTAVVARALRGGMQARLAPQRPDEAARLGAAGVDVDRVLDASDLVSAPAFFAAAGVTDGSLVRGPWLENGLWHTEAIVVADGVRRVVDGRAE
jgi:fructose-1,6-bisphosphatase II